MKAELVEISSNNGHNIGLSKQIACDALLKKRLEVKGNSAKANKILNRLHVTVPKQRDTKERPH